MRGFGLLQDDGAAMTGTTSQGFGCDGGVGSMVDNGSDQNRYREGPSGRINGATRVEPQTACFDRVSAYSRMTVRGK